MAAALLVSSFALVAALGSKTIEIRTTATIGEGAQQLAQSVDEASGGEAKVCNYRDTSPGMGGQGGKCKFACAYPGTVTVSVRAGDGDAFVAGSASCNGNTEASCSDKGSCSETSTTSTGGAGECSGSSSETWDSGISVSCSSDATKPGSGPGSVREPVCPLVIQPSPPYPRICIDPSDGRGDVGYAADASPRLPLDLCKVHDVTTGKAVCLDASFNQTRLGALNAHILGTFGAQEGVPAGHIFARAGLATGLVCIGYDCVQVAASIHAATEGAVVRLAI